MEFREILALAKKKQDKHNSEVKIADKILKQKDVERKLQLKVANDLNRKSSNLASFVPKCDEKIKQVDLKESKNVTPKQSRDITSKTTCKTATAKTHMNDIIIKQKAGTKQTECSQNSVDRKIKIKPSFSEILEMAKKNVDVKLGDKRPYENLIPCTYDSTYRKLDTISNTKLKVNKQNSDLKIKNSSDIDSLKLKDRSINAPQKVLQKNEVNSPKESLQQRQVNSRCNILNQIKSTSHIKRSNSLIGQNVERKNRNESRIICHNETKAPRSEKKAAGSSKIHNKTTINSQSKLNMKEKPNQINVNKFLSNTNSSIKTDDYRNAKSVNKIESKPSKGIAAQLGISNTSIPNYEEDADDYESDNSFIDDSEVIQSKDYARMVQDIHKTLRFDPRKYQDVNPWDDLRSMEAKYRDIEKEEKRSARLGALEDQQEMENEMRLKKAKMKKLRMGI